MNATHGTNVTDAQRVTAQELFVLVARQHRVRLIAIRYSAFVCTAMLCAQTASQLLRSLVAG
jgi:hypothetical protein